jgi:hypothetical protein
MSVRWTYHRVSVCLDSPGSSLMSGKTKRHGCPSHACDVPQVVLNQAQNHTADGRSR